MGGLANQALLARHLLQTEFPWGELTEIPGGHFVNDDAGWIGVSNPSEIAEPEAWFRKQAELTEQQGKELSGVVLLSPAEAPVDPSIEALEEVLYVYGYPRAKGLNRGGPDVVQIIPNTPAVDVTGQCEVKPAADNMDAANSLFSVAAQTADRITGPAWNRAKSWIERAEPWVFLHEGQPAGLLSYVYGELIGRVVMFVVAEETRDQGIGRGMLAHAQRLSSGRGALFTSVWNYRDGRLRYYMTKQGFSEQINVRYYLAGPAD